MKRLAPIGLLACLFLAACSSPTPPSPSAPVLPMTWSPWNNEAQGYSLGLPLDWVLNDVTSKNSEIIRFASPSGELLEVTAYAADSLDSAMHARDASTATGYEGQPSITVLDSVDLQIDGEPAIRRHERMNAAGMDSYAAYTFHNGKLYQLRFTREDGSIPDLSLFDEVLGSFGFAPQPE